MKTFFAISGLVAATLLAAACGGDDVPTDGAGPVHTGGTSAGGTSAGGTSAGGTSSAGAGGSGGQAGGAGGAGGCPKPVTHVEIINACTDAQAIELNPVLPLLGPGGALPPLP